MAEVENPSELGKAALRIQQLRREAEERSDSGSEQQLKEMVRENREMIQSTVQAMTKEIIEALRPLIQINAETKDRLTSIEKSQKKAGETLAELDQSVETMHSGLEEQLTKLLKATDNNAAQINHMSQQLGDRLFSLDKTMQASLSVLKTIHADQRDLQRRRDDEQEEVDHQRAARRSRDVDSSRYRDNEGRFTKREPLHKTLIKSLASGAMHAGDWLKGFLGFGEGAAGGAIAGMFGPLLAGAGAFAMGLLKFGIIGSIVAVIATTLMSSIFKAKKRLEAQGITEFSEQFKIIAKDMYTSIIEIAQGAVGSVLSLMSRIPVVGPVFAKLEEGVNSFASWLTDFSSTNEKTLKEAEERMNISSKELAEAQQKLQESEEHLSTLYRHRRRAEATGDQSTADKLTKEIELIEQQRIQRKELAERLEQQHKKIEKHWAKEKNGGVVKFWENTIKPIWDSLSSTMSKGLEWMKEMGKSAAERWQKFSDFWLNLKDDVAAKLDDWSTNLKKMFTDTLPGLLTSATDKIKEAFTNIRTGLTETLPNKLSELGTMIKESIMSLFDLSWWKEKLKSVLPERFTGQKAQPDAAAPKQTPEVVPQAPKAPSVDIVPSAPAANDNVSVPYAAFQPKLLREPTKLDPKLDRLEKLMVAIAEGKREQQTKALMTGVVNNVVAPQNISIVSNQHNQMAVSPRPVSHSTLGQLTRVSNWG